MEEAIYRSENPVVVDETHEIAVNDVRGIWLNKNENLNWKGEIPLDQYKLNVDPSPIVISKKPSETIQYKQEIAVRYLNPPYPPTPGDVIIKQEPNRQISPAPPLIIRQQPPRLATPPPLVIREAPPKTPEPIPTKVITIGGKVIPPPPRKVVIEKLPDMPPKPQSILVERWLAYKEPKRRVVYQRPPEECNITYPDPKNVIVEVRIFLSSDLKYAKILTFLCFKQKSGRDQMLKCNSK